MKAQPISQIAALFAAVKGNARVMVITEGISAVPLQWYNTYLSLYMVALGVSALEIEWLTSIGKKKFTV